MAPKKKKGGKKKGGKKKGKKPGTASSTASSKDGKKGKKGKGKKKKTKKELAPEDIHLPPAREEMLHLGLVEFYHGETPQQQFENTQLFRSYKMPQNHRPPSPMTVHKNVRQMYTRRFPQLNLSRNLD